MEKTIYHKMAAIEDIHWWFVGRRNIAKQIIDKLELSNKPIILEVGCGSGGNFSLLAAYGELKAIEPDETAIHYARKRGIAQVLPGSLPYDIPFDSEIFDLIVMMDVLEHVNKDELSLKLLRDKIKNNGHLLLTVPACPRLWSKHDELHHHKRRYTRKSLCKVITDSGYNIVFISYINSILFIFIITLRIIKRLSKDNNTDDLKMPFTWINILLTKLYLCEGYLLKYFRFPIGLSLIMLAQKVNFNNLSEDI